MIRSKADFLHYLSEDLRHYQLRRFTVKDYLLNDTLRFQRRLRKIEYLANCRSGNPFCAVYRRFLVFLNAKLAVKLGFTIPINVFGPGLCIVHYGTVVVSGLAKVGKNCRIHPGTCIGQYHGAPVLGDNVYVGPGAKIFGDIRIGDNVAIGANAVVAKSFPDNVTIGGIPAQIISNGSSLETGVFPEGFVRMTDGDE